MDYSQLMDRARKAVASPSLHSDEELAGIALALSVVHGAAEAALEPLKTELRAIAREDLWGSSPQASTLPRRIELPAVYEPLSSEGQDGDALPLRGMVTVTFPQKQVKVVKDADLEALRLLLGEEEFSRYFEARTQYTPRKDFQEQVKAKMEGIPPGDQAALSPLNVLLASVEYVEPTPRVGFPTEVTQ